MMDWTGIAGFDWDDGNSRKSAEKPNVRQSETEQIFFNQSLLVLADDKHSQNELRYHALGETDDARLLHRIKIEANKRDISVSYQGLAGKRC